MSQSERPLGPLKIMAPKTESPKDPEKSKGEPEVEDEDAIYRAKGKAVDTTVVSFFPALRLFCLPYDIF
jgi:hypothetical protein